MTNYIQQDVTQQKHGEYGSVYSYDDENNKWIQKKYIGDTSKQTGWIHIFNMKKFKDKLFLAGETYNSSSAQNKYSHVQYSTDNGQTYNNVKIMNNDNDFSYKIDGRTVSIFEYKNELYMLYFNIQNSYVQYGGTGIYKYDEENNQFNYYSHAFWSMWYASTGNVPSSVAWAIICRGMNFEYNGKLYFISGKGLYSTTDLQNVNLVKMPDESIIQNVVVDDEIAYIMSYIYNEDKSYTTKIYSTKDFEVFNKIYEFDIDTTPVSFEYYDNSFYIGTDLGEKRECKDSSKNGSLYKVTLIK